MFKTIVVENKYIANSLKSQISGSSWCYSTLILGSIPKNKERKVRSFVVMERPAIHYYTKSYAYTCPSFWYNVSIRAILHGLNLRLKKQKPRSIAMLSSILKIRGLQFLRGIREMGWIVFPLFAVAAYLLFFIFLQLGTNPINYMIVGAFLVMMLSLQLYRKDKQFLDQLSDTPNLITFTEYGSLSIPLLCALLYHQQWLLILLIPIVLYGISLIKYTPKSAKSNHSILNYLPDDAFEWKAVIRKNFYAFVLLLAGGFLTSFLIGSVPIALFFIGTIFFGMYNEGEPVPFLLAKELPPKAFLWHKIKQGQFIFSLLSFPLIIAFIFFHTHIWYVPIIEYVMFSMLIHYALVVKYTFYSPNESLTSGQFFLSFGIMSLFIPFMIPVMIVLGIRFYFRSLNNLNFYLHDFH